MKKFVALVGTNTAKSTNRKLLQYMKKRYADDAEIEVVELKGLPIFKKSEEVYIPQQARDIADKIDASDGVIIGTPEYDHSIPALLSSALAWLSYGIHPLMDKPVMIVGTSYGTLGASRAQAQLRQILDSPELKATVLPSSEFLLGHSLQAFDDNGDLKSATESQKLDGLFDDFLEFVDLTEKLGHSKQIHEQEASSTFSWDNGTTGDDK
ncbi:NADPH-dependent FMN reductase [Secundilactobacillus mixtipabuli]|uniref:NADPH-dependent FMN reductase n=1 Tax=Secundilactobacillus mixtipabuli TaxID=1435342 RepID=A0A1Z5I9G9_9LACO|nr:NADPH-dependent FMN reductase [Secundilactobacillus mixtipabuli]GAW98436.1 NADPH-dependent FMN reductase [Secundilactobacillus mixtipabuli]